MLIFIQVHDKYNKKYTDILTLIDMGFFEPSVMGGGGAWGPPIITLLLLLRRSWNFAQVSNLVYSALR